MVLAVVLLAMFPMVESRIAIPLALSTAIWGENTLSPALAFLIGFVGSSLPVIVVIFLVKKIKNKTSGFVHDRFLSMVQGKYHAKIEKMRIHPSTFRKCFSLATFVAVPLPLTGVYSGALIAGISNLKIWQGFVSVIVGEAVSCAVVLLISVAFDNSAFYLFLFSLALIVIFVVVNLSIFIFKKIKQRKDHREIEIKPN